MRMPGRFVVRLLVHSGAATLVEFAFVAAPLIALLLAALQISLVFFAQQCLDTTGEQAERLLMTGSAQKSGFTQAQFSAAVCAKLPPYMSCPNVMIDVQVVSDFASANTAAPTITYDSHGNVSNKWTYKPGAPGEITVLRLMYAWKVSKTPFGFDLSTIAAGQRLLVSTMVFKTEPYQ